MILIYKLTRKHLLFIYLSQVELEDGRGRRSVDVDDFANLTACCDLDLLSPKSLQNLTRSSLGADEYSLSVLSKL